jgi:Uma2 family endonuclease
LLKAHVAEHASGRAIFAPLPVRLWPGTYREPDIVYLNPERMANTRGYPQGADLAIEVVSEGTENRERDLEVKRAEYARAGIPEYWIVDPQDHRITVLTLQADAYQVHGVFGAGETATSRLLPGFCVPLDAAFAAGEGNSSERESG